MFARPPFSQAKAHQAINPAAVHSNFRLISCQRNASAVISKDFSDLARIYEQGVNLCLIERCLSNTEQTFVADVLSQHYTIELSILLNPKRYDFNSLWPQAAHLSGYSAWLGDVAHLTTAFCELFDRQQVGLRLRTLDKAMCPRFHVDRVPVRMVCSYGGLGTEWLPEHAVDRTRLGMGNGGLPDYSSGLITASTEMQTMPAYAVALMKGELWEGNENQGLVHRSPSPTEQQPRRLLLTLDML
ncbi:DUF1826 domain-containing protein [Methylocucumis oryzae]|uniref:DUF1826 domain-containing protein n=1 Tax=Methylocucumis oryzae TaxID=1632867 RepID=UPI0009E2A655|nr:DUF1826 domain-containing protein [Methylocucumis oryzae]